MWHRLRTVYQLNVSSDTVRNLLLDVDPEGVSDRRRKRLKRCTYRTMGPLYTIHVDGYDKLKPYGFPIHGAICGFSRKVLWLRVGRSNNNPHVVAGYFIDFVRETKGVPRKIRCDRGTENTVIQHMQVALRSIHTDKDKAERSITVGRSVSNQRIERWWGTLRNSNAQYWMDLFKDLEEADLFNRDIEMQRECLRFCFMEILQTELCRTRLEWNTHRMQRSGGECPAGKPDLLFSNPQVHGAVLYTFHVPDGIVDEIEREFVVCEHPSGTTDQYYTLFMGIMERLGLTMPHTAQEGLQLYGRLLSELENQ